MELRYHGDGNKYSDADYLVLCLGLYYCPLTHDLYYYTFRSQVGSLEWWAWVEKVKATPYILIITSGGT